MGSPNEECRLIASSIRVYSCNSWPNLFAFGSSGQGCPRSDGIRVIRGKKQNHEKHEIHEIRERLQRTMNQFNFQRAGQNSIQPGGKFRTKTQYRKYQLMRLRSLRRLTQLYRKRTASCWRGSIVKNLKAACSNDSYRTDRADSHSCGAKEVQFAAIALG